MRSDDISGLFGPGPSGMGASSQFYQGSIASFDPVTGNNTVTMLGATLTNVSYGLTGAEVNYSAGDRVILIKIGNTFTILCKTVAAGSSGFGQASSQAQASGNSASGFTATSGQHTWATTTLAVPPWATKAAVSAWCTACVHSAADQDVGIGVDLNGANVDFVTFWGAGGHTVSAHVGGSLTYTIAPGTTTLSAAGWLNPSATITSAANFLVANIQATFYRS